METDIAKEYSQLAPEATNEITKTQYGSSVLLTPELIFADLAPKVCVVCGDKALSCNFGVISCESCKAFFRRNAHKDGKMKIKCIGACEVEVKNRSRCKRCRLQKCIENGMKKDLILNDEQKLERKRKIELNKLKKSEPDNLIGDTSVPVFEKEEGQSPHDSLDNIDTVIGEVCLTPSKRPALQLQVVTEAFAKTTVSENLLSTARTLPYVTSLGGDSRLQLLSESHRIRSNDPQLHQPFSEPEHIKEGCTSVRSDSQNTNSGLSSVKSESIDTKYGMSYLSMHSCSSAENSPNTTGVKGSSAFDQVSPFSSRSSSLSEDSNISIEKAGKESLAEFIPPFKCPLYGNCIPEEVLHKLEPDIAEVLSHTFAAFACAMDQPLKKDFAKYPSSIEWFNQCEVGVEVIVKMAKNLPSFQKFDQDDQIVLLKGSVVDLLICQSIRAYDDINMRFVLPDCNLRGGSSSQPRFSSYANVWNNVTDKLHVELKTLMCQYVKFFRVYTRASKGELSVLMCIIVILLYMPRINSTYKEKGRAQYWFETYLEALKHLINVMYPQGDLKLEEVMDSLELLKELSSVFQITLQKATPSELSPLISEVLDIHL